MNCYGSYGRGVPNDEKITHRRESRDVLDPEAKPNQVDPDGRIH